MTDSTRVFNAQYALTNDGRHFDLDLTITVTGYGPNLKFFVNAEEISLQMAENIRQNALAHGTFTRISGPELTPAPVVIGKAVACKLHKELGRLGISKHYACAQEALGYPVSTLATLTAEEAITVWGYACALAERPTLPSVVFGLVAA